MGAWLSHLLCPEKTQLGEGAQPPPLGGEGEQCRWGRGCAWSPGPSNRPPFAAACSPPSGVAGLASPGGLEQTPDFPSAPPGPRKQWLRFLAFSCFPSKISLQGAVLSLFYGVGNHGSERLGNFAKATELQAVEHRFELRTVRLVFLPFSPHFLLLFLLLLPLLFLFFFFLHKLLINVSASP